MKTAFTGMVMAATLAGSAAADPFENFGTAMKYALPLAGAVCAADQGRLEDYAVRGLIQVVVVRGLKSWFDGTPIGTRPVRATEVGRGFPSGHTAAAAFGAADLAGKCFPDDVAAGAAAYGAAGLTGVSRIHAGQHTAQQVWAGGLIGFSFGAADFGIGTEGASFSVGMRF
ncbi:phosphatase PAP2 family protein [Paracoccus sp. TK19116]|uniref:Phosphatase PAP2 family protein n=1 Tax=Paracoccus albicereus TaxID=2922394 RepID=A0ABT1MRH0_9RHOB|nr:phosphatase PAP2 family protein [Paracoccus albicereus]MCQ0969933.1 phosphatase PAP2 family protein [Paracoccus albicereus]